MEGGAKYTIVNVDISAGLYDTWAARDVCGTPLRAFWPYVKDEASVALLRKEEPFPVAACWNGAVVFPTGPFLYNPDFGHHEGGRTLSARGWKMVDGRTSSYPVISNESLR